jgi:hypothetical protein
VAQFLVGDYGLRRRQALFISKLVEGKSISAASQESSMTTGEARKQEIRGVQSNDLGFPATRFSWLGRGTAGDPSEGCSPC